MSDPTGDGAGRSWEQLLRTTPARLGTGRAGPRPRTAPQLSFRADHARARDAVHSVWSEPFRRRLAELGFVSVRSAARDRDEYLLRPDRGRALAPGEAERIRAGARPGARVQIALSDGLSARAGERHLERLWPVLCRGLERLGPLAVPVCVDQGRVAIADEICAASGASLTVHLIGERPGLAAPESLGAYLTLRPRPGVTTDAGRKCISNIHARGMAPDEAGAAISELARCILEADSSGTDLQL